MERARRRRSRCPAVRSCRLHLQAAQPIDLRLESTLERGLCLEPENGLGARDVADGPVAVGLGMIERDIAIGTTQPQDEPRDVSRRPCLTRGDVERALRPLLESAKKCFPNICHVDAIELA